MIRLEFIALVSLGVALGAAVSWWSGEFEEAAMVTSDCVFDLWQEHEGRTGRIPSVELELAWWTECSESDNG